MNNSERCKIHVRALTSLSTPQTINIVGYIKKQRVIVTIDFIDKILAESHNFFKYPVTHFQVLVANGGSMCYHI
jgi:hypothetical protein